jgi:hypothetical protein
MTTRKWLEDLVKTADAEVKQSFKIARGHKKKVKGTMSSGIVAV